LVPFSTYVVMSVVGVTPDSSNPRAQKASLGGAVSRLSAAQLNMVEGLVLVGSAVGLAINAGVDASIVLSILTYYGWTRKIYVLCYAADWTVVRTLMYMSGVLS